MTQTLLRLIVMSAALMSGNFGSLLGTTRTFEEVNGDGYLRQDVLVEGEEITLDFMATHSRRVARENTGKPLIVLRYYRDSSARFQGINPSHLSYEALLVIRRRAASAAVEVGEAIYGPKGIALRLRRSSGVIEQRTVGAESPLEMTVDGKHASVVLLQYRAVSADEPTREELDIYITTDEPLTMPFVTRLAGRSKNLFRAAAVNVFVGNSAWFPFTPTFPIYFPLAAYEPPASESEFRLNPYYACYAFLPACHAYGGGQQ